jgi:hypothetical protein
MCLHRLFVTQHLQELPARQPEPEYDICTQHLFIRCCFVCKTQCSKLPSLKKNIGIWRGDFDGNFFHRLHGTNDRCNLLMALAIDEQL